MRITLYPGQYQDAETGLYYNYHRYYDPRIGRYLRKDPMGLKGGKNIFSYVENNPMNSLDSTGLWVEPDQIISPLKSYELVYESDRKIAELFFNIHLFRVTRGVDLDKQEFLADFFGYGAEFQLYKKHKKSLDFGLSLIDEHRRIFHNGLLLPYMGLRKFWPGGNDKGSNQFVFTCKYGWIDMGHFYIMASVGYWNNLVGTEIGPLNPLLSALFLDSDLDYLFSLLNEVRQFLKIYHYGRGHGGVESAFTPEDFASNYYGDIFGREVATELLFNRSRPQMVPKKWSNFLVDAGAVAYKENDMYHKLLKKDVEKWWDRSNPSGALYIGPRRPWHEIKHLSAAYCLLCDGDKPRLGVPRYKGPYPWNLW